MDHSEVSELSLVEKLKEPSDFQLWKFKVNILFKSQGLYGIVCGEVKAPEQGSSDYADYMYRILSDMYEHDVSQKKFDLMQEFFGYKYTAGVDLATYMSKLENLVFRLKVLGKVIPENMLISRILMTVPEKYSYFISAWESTPVDSETMTNLTTGLIAKEKRSADSRTETDVVAFKAAVKNVTRLPISFLVAGCNAVYTEWILDSGSTCHMTYDNSLLENTRAVKTDIGLAKKSASMNAESVGRVVTDYCELKKVLYVPQLSKNILLVGSITQNREVNFTKNEVAVIKESVVPIRGRKGANELYVVTMTRNSISKALVAECKNLGMTWHRRLGHISQDLLKVASRIIKGMNLKVHKLRTDNGKEYLNERLRA
ncbi:hypothetical protein PR048_027545 [Dryococelus australis]|uniref:GAG-pre-integrase domain-containing protein n=1 Tax=Dryococelus australis TaxID=614101 RepID=A0ABQ9GGU3_9NEOP|nr:hypothetical protein PR048_027545 [Dryococelus australis]